MKAMDHKIEQQAFYWMQDYHVEIHGTELIVIQIRVRLRVSGIW